MILAAPLWPPPWPVVVGFLVWGSVAIPMIVTTMAYAGSNDEFEAEDLAQWLAFSIFWPFLAIFFIISSPYWIARGVKYWQNRTRTTSMAKYQKKLSKAKKLVEEVKRACPQV
jgi:hypothetical protein